MRGLLTTLSTALVLIAGGCDGPVEEIPRLRDTTGVDPELLARVQAAVREAEAEREVQALVELAMLYDANGLWEYALGTYELSLKADPDRPELWYHTGRMRAELSDPAGALAAFDTTIGLAETYAPAHWRRGELLFALGRIDQAERAFLRALELQRDAAPAWLGLARVHLQRGEPAEVVALLEPLVERNHREPFANGLLARAYRQLGEDQRAANALRREERASKPSVADPWTARVMSRAVGVFVALEQAGAALARGDARAALAVIEPLYAERADELAVVEMYSRALTRAGRQARALEVLQKARRASPDNYRLELSTGLALQGQGMSERARAHLERAVGLNPSYGEAHVALGEVYLELGDYAGAEESFRSAVDLGERAVRVWMLLARAQMDRNDPDGAVETLMRAFDEYPNSANLWAYLAEAEIRRGQIDSARVAVRKVEERNPQHELLEELRAQLSMSEENGTQRDG